MRVSVDKEVPAYQSYAAERTRGLYNVDAADGQRFQLEAELPVEKDDWQIGVVVGPSGSGKTSIAEELCRDGWIDANILTGGLWSQHAPVIEDMTTMAGDYAKATAALAATGLGSVPSWLRPRRVLSNGERFRADMAALLVHAGPSATYYIDEFTSVLDRQVAKVGAGAFAKTWRKKPGRRVILVTPHYDVLEWIQPDWIVDTAGGDTLGGGHVEASNATFSYGKEAFPGPAVGSIMVGGGKPTTYVRQHEEEEV